MRRAAGSLALLLLAATGCSGFLPAPTIPKQHAQTEKGGGGGVPPLSLGLRAAPRARGRPVPAAMRMTISERQESGRTRKEEDANSIWTKAWYPLAVEGELHLNKPNIRWLLGRKIVIFRDESAAAPEGGGWRAVDDRCPHRLAPMSMGRVDRAEGKITCRYHGWEFNGEGSCIKIPGNLKGIESSSPRNCITSFPTQVRQGLVWVWGDDGPGRHVESRAKDPPVMPELEGDRLFVARYFPVDWVYMTENSFDPLHAQFLHEGAAPMYKPEAAVPIQGYKLMKVSPSEAIQDTQISEKVGESTEEGDIAAEGFTLQHRGYSKGNANMKATRVYSAPNSVSVRYREAPFPMTSQLYFVPARPGWTGVVAGFSLSGMSGNRKAPRLQRLVRASFGLLNKVVGAVVPEHFRMAAMHNMGTDTLGQQDLVCMSGVEEYTAKEGKPWEKAYSMSSSDAGVIAFRRWMDRFASEGVPWHHTADLSPKPREMSRLMDRYESHTKYCRHCSKALPELTPVIKRLETSSLVVASLGLLAAALRNVPCLAISIAALACLLKVKGFAEGLRRRMISGLPEGAQEPNLKHPDGV